MFSAIYSVYGCKRIGMKQIDTPSALEDAVAEHAVVGEAAAAPVTPPMQDQDPLPLEDPASEDDDAEAGGAAADAPMPATFDDTAAEHTFAGHAVEHVEVAAAAAAALPMPVAVAEAGAATAAAPAAAMAVQNGPMRGYVMPEIGELLVINRAVGRLTEWPANKPSNLACKCFVHGGKRCKGLWPKHRAPPYNELMDWLRLGPSLSFEEHMRRRPA